MIDISNVLLDPELGCVGFTVVRTSYRLHQGETIATENRLSAEGCIHPGTAEMAQLLPDEEKAKEFIAVYTSTMLTQGENFGGNTFTGADRIEYQGDLWRVVRVKRWIAFDYCHALAVRFEG